MSPIHSAVPEWSNAVVTDGLITALTAKNFNPEIVDQTIDRVVNTTLVGLTGSWKESRRPVVH